VFYRKKTGEAHWENLAAAPPRLSKILAICLWRRDQIGIDKRGMPRAHGHSMIISPWGEVLACGSADKQELSNGEINKDVLNKARFVLPGIIKY